MSSRVIGDGDGISIRLKIIRSNKQCVHVLHGSKVIIIITIIV